MASGGDSFEADAVEAVDGEEEKEARRGGRRSLALGTRLLQHVMCIGGDITGELDRGDDGDENQPKKTMKNRGLHMHLKDDEEEETALAASNGARRVVAWASRCSMVCDDGKRQSHGSKHAAAGIPSFAP